MPGPDPNPGSGRWRCAVKETGALWHLPPPDLAWSSGDIHVWRALLDQPADRVRELEQTLTYDEMARAGRFHFDRDRRRFIVGRSVLRAILGRYLGVEPGQLRFCYGERGKPHLVDGCGSYTPRFNVSHSHELALYALTRDREVGVDVEYVKPIPDAEQIAERFFSAQENITFQALPEHLKHQAFFTCWTRKEAYIKARGDGLALALDQFDVSLAPGEPATLLNRDGLSEDAPGWSLLNVAPGTGYVGAAAVQGRGWQLRCWEWSWPRE